MIEITREVEAPLCSSLPPEVAEQDEKEVCDNQNFVSKRELFLNNKKSEENMLPQEKMEVVILDMIEIEKEIEEPVEEFLESVAPKMEFDASIKVENQFERMKEASKALLELASGFADFNRANIVEPIAEGKHEIFFENLNEKSKIDSLVCEEFDSEATLSASEIQEYLHSDEELINPHRNTVDYIISDDHNYCLPYSANIKLSSSALYSQQTCDRLENVLDIVPRGPKSIIVDHPYTKRPYVCPPLFITSPLTKVMPRKRTKKQHLQKNHHTIPKEEDFHSACMNYTHCTDNPSNVPASSKKRKKDHNNSLHHFDYATAVNYHKLDKREKAVSNSCETSNLNNSRQLPQRKETVATIKKKYQESKAKYKASGRGKIKKPRETILMKDKSRKSAPVHFYRKKYISDSSSASNSDNNSDSSFESSSDSSSDSSDEDKPLIQLKSKRSTSDYKDSRKEIIPYCNRNKLPSFGKSNSLQNPSCSISPSHLYNSQSKKRSSSKKECPNPTSDSKNPEIHLKKLVVVLEDCMKLNNIIKLSPTKHVICNSNKSSSYKSNYLQNSPPSKLSSRIRNSIKKKRNSSKKNSRESTTSSDSINHAVHLKKLVVVLEDCMKLNYMTQLLPNKHRVCDRNASDLESDSVHKQYSYITSLNNIENKRVNNIADLHTDSKSKSCVTAQTSISECLEESNTKIFRIKSESVLSDDLNSLKVMEYIHLFPNTKECTSHIPYNNEDESKMVADPIFPLLIDDIKIEPFSADENENSDSDVELLYEKEPTAELITLEDDNNGVVESTVIAELEKDDNNGVIESTEISEHEKEGNNGAFESTEISKFKKIDENEDIENTVISELVKDDNYEDVKSIAISGFENDDNNEGVESTAISKFENDGDNEVVENTAILKVEKDDNNEDVESTAISQFESDDNNEVAENAAISEVENDDNNEDVESTTISEFENDDNNEVVENTAISEVEKDDRNEVVESTAISEFENDDNNEVVENTAIAEIEKS